MSRVYIFVYMLVISVLQYAAMKSVGMSEDTQEIYLYDKQPSIVLVIAFILAVALQAAARFKLFGSYDIIVVFIYGVSLTAYMFIYAETKKRALEKRKEEVEQVYLILQKLIGAKKTDELDLSDIPFTLQYKHGMINHIDVNVEPSGFNEKNLSTILEQLNGFFPNFTWVYELHLDKRFISFLGEDIPPTYIRWPGSWLRDAFCIPLGISGKGEVAYRPDSAVTGDEGISSYKDEFNEAVILDKSLLKTPMAMVAGTTGSGKSIYIEQAIF